MFIVYHPVVVFGLRYALLHCRHTAHLRDLEVEETGADDTRSVFDIVNSGSGLYNNDRGTSGDGCYHSAVSSCMIILIQTV